MPQTEFRAAFRSQADAESTAEGAAGGAQAVFGAGQFTLVPGIPSTPGEEDTRAGDVIDLAGKFAADGTLNWNAPAGDWQVLRIRVHAE